MNVQSDYSDSEARVASPKGIYVKIISNNVSIQMNYAGTGQSCFMYAIYTIVKT